MRVTHLRLEGLRSYERADLELSAGVTAFLGPNGAGKTNLLEAIHLLARGDSPRSRDDAELVRWGAETARVTATVERHDGERRVEMLLFGPRPGERRRQRRYLLDGAAKRADEVIGLIVVVAFFPEDVELLADAPGARRRYLDAMISQVDRRHRADTREYQRVLEQRNALLRALREREGDRASELAFWDAELCRLAASISHRRIHAVAEAREAFRAACLRLSGDRDTDIAYLSPIKGSAVDERADGYRLALAEKRDRELWQGVTLVGPHREDLAVTAAGRALPSFASRGEQRSAVLSLKLAEASWLISRCGEAPIFLLDDVLSELDAERRDRLVRALPGDAQALITSALPAGLPAILAGSSTIVAVQPGRVG